jgi:hypothetical protein
MQSISANTTTKGLKNCKLVNFFSVQPPVGNPNLAKVGKIRMFYLQFMEDTRTWTAKCSKAGATASTYNLDVEVFQIDMEINRQLCHIVYPKMKEMLEGSAVDGLMKMLGESAASGTEGTISLPIDSASPIGTLPKNT